ncbi:MAG: UvrD-helicase domain-containing protein [Myxococcales bacterium]|nr:UvrD-helicase domain-containing protein [Myxococcales bacterium]
MIARYPRPAALAEIPLDRHAVVEASAGTGKTYTIEHLVVDRLLRAGVTLEALLVVTFTDKATTELRARIRALIEAVLAAPVDPAIDPVGFDPAAAEVVEPDVWFIDGARRQALEEALFAFDRAPIHTIHAWCRRVLIDMAFDSGQLFEQDRVDGQVAFKRAWRVTLRHELAREPAPRARLERWLRAGRDEGELERLLWAAHQKRYLDAREPVEEELGPLMAAFAADFDPGAVLADLLGWRSSSGASTRRRRCSGGSATCSRARRTPRSGSKRWCGSISTRCSRRSARRWASRSGGSPMSCGRRRGRRSIGWGGCGCCGGCCARWSGRWSRRSCRRWRRGSTWGSGGRGSSTTTICSIGCGGRWKGRTGRRWPRACGRGIVMASSMSFKTPTRGSGRSSGGCSSMGRMGSCM